MLSECFWNYLTVLCEASDDLLLRKAAAATLNECEISISFVSAYICIQNLNSYQCPEYWGRLHFSQFTQKQAILLRDNAYFNHTELCYGFNNSITQHVPHLLHVYRLSTLPCGF